MLWYGALEGNKQDDPTSLLFKILHREAPESRRPIGSRITKEEGSFSLVTCIPA